MSNPIQTSQYFLNNYQFDDDIAIELDTISNDPNRGGHLRAVAIATRVSNRIFNEAIIPLDILLRRTENNINIQIQLLDIKIQIIDLYSIWVNAAIAYSRPISFQAA